MKHSHYTISTQILFMLGVFLLLFGARLEIINQLASFAPYYDDWGMGGTLQEHKSGELTLAFLLKPANGHLGLWREFLQIFLFDLNQQQWDTHLQMVVNSVIWAATGVLLIIITRTHFHHSAKNTLTVFILTFWMFPASLINATWGVQTHSYFMMLFSIAGLWLISAPAKTAQWWFGLFLVWAATLTMGGGSLVAPAVFGVTIIKYLLAEQQAKKALQLTLWASFALSIYCILLLSYSSGGHELFYAKSVGDFVTVFLKALSFPLQTLTWPSIVFTLPVLILAWQVLISKEIEGRAANFILLLASFHLLMAITIGYARGYNGWSPSPRYFEFFQSQVIVSLMALALVVSQRTRLSINFSIALTTLWVGCFGFGAIQQTKYLASEIQTRSVFKPQQEKAIRHYLVDRNSTSLKTKDIRAVPFASGAGLAYFIEKVDQEPIWSAQLQVPPMVERDNKVVDGFVKNPTFAPANTDFITRYKTENAWGSYNPDQGAFAAKGVFVSSLMQPTHDTLIFPVMGYVGFDDIELKLVEEGSGKVTPIRPEELTLEGVDHWRSISVKSPQEPYRIIAADRSDTLWMAFANPRVVGRLSVITNNMISNSHAYWAISLLILLLLSAKTISRLCGLRD